MSNETTTTCPQAEDWTLHCCCNSVQLQVIIATSVYTVLLFLLWRTPVVFPLKLFTVAMYEINRALGCWITCGRVVGLNLFESSGGGSSEFRGGNGAVIALFGHLGSVAWGLACIVASADYVGVQVLSGFICALLLVLLVFSRTWRVGGSIVFLLALIAAFWACTVLTVFNGLRFLVLAVGVTSLFFPLYNVCLVPKRFLPRTMAGGGSTAAAAGEGEMVEMSAVSKTAGFLWGLVSLAVAAAGVYLALVVGSNPDGK